MPKQKVCPGSNRWAEANNRNASRGRCNACGKLIWRNAQGVLFTHKRIEKP